MPQPVCEGKPEAMYASPKPPDGAAGAGAGVYNGCAPKGDGPAGAIVGGRNP
jgi:hypothetical protein